MLGVGEQFPDGFLLNGVDRNNNMVTFDSDSLYGDWSVIYFYPKDFTFICPTEIAAFDTLVNHCNVVGISGDNEFCKLAWKQDNKLIQGIKHTLVADCGLAVSEELDIVNRDEGVCYRATYILDEDATIQHVSVNALDTGRNAEEILRTLQALKAGGLTGCDWQPGDDFVA